MESTSFLLIVMAGVFLADIVWEIAKVSYYKMKGGKKEVAGE